MVSQGKTNQEIAKALHIAEITVKKRLSQKRGTSCPSSTAW